MPVLSDVDRMYLIDTTNPASSSSAVPLFMVTSERPGNSSARIGLRHPEMYLQGIMIRGFNPVGRGGGDF